MLYLSPWAYVVTLVVQLQHKGTRGGGGPRAAVARPRPGPKVFLPPTLPRPFSSLLGMDSPGDPAWVGRFPAVAERRLLPGGGGALSLSLSNQHILNTPTTERR